ncbi:adhesion G protein-coupled receptor G3 isoform X4 [Homo sapiens]|uniref:adhesion G protein-coupled receptor G3 isoform X4 n=1 Tax=Homo sapiens TaxID=9606 RepID=UPI0005D03F07|nr:adhesion G protein-coupled receptor G3 isoform X4 [Homo sapiens]XP_054235796.1 adhesion G protein-coupled receptor G3 isoform X4 [Homo sapiens]|eukprot:XP_011521255.1 adhesion G protein-coupled receptor G3 isoform X3 [Homo sapiens]
MATPRGLGALLLLLLLPTSGQEKPTEGPRNTCLGSNNMYDIFNLNDKALCFTKCRQSGSDSCNVENLQRYWLNYEAHLMKEGLTQKVNTPFLKALVQNLSTNTAEDFYFSLEPSQVPRQVMKDEDKPPDRVRLPKSLFRSLPGNRSVVRLAVTILDIGPGTLFKGPRLGLGDGSGVLNNRLVGLSVGQMHVTKLAEPLEIVFSHQRPPPNMTLTCVFWDVTKGTTGDWSSEGCSTEVRPEGTVCCCDHLTFFALLLRPTLDQSTVHILTRISQAGCGVSMIFLAFTIILYAFLRCWFREGTTMYALYITVHGYFLITFLFGMVVLALVVWKIFTLSRATAVKERGKNRKKVLTLLGLSSLVGVTWGLAIFTPLGLSTVYIFALFNSLQGVFICCWFTILYLPSQSTTVSSSTARLDQAHSASQE